MLKDAFEAVAPYISNIEEIRRFVKENEKLEPQEIIKLLEKMIEEEQGTLITDYRILLNEVRKRINMEM